MKTTQGTTTRWTLRWKWTKSKKFVWSFGHALRGAVFVIDFFCQRLGTAVDGVLVTFIFFTPEEGHLFVHACIRTSMYKKSVTYMMLINPFDIPTQTNKNTTLMS